MRSDLPTLEDGEPEGRGDHAGEVDAVVSGDSSGVSAGAVDPFNFDGDAECPYDPAVHGREVPGVVEEFEGPPVPGVEVVSPNLVRFQFKDRELNHARVAQGWFSMEFDKKDEPFSQTVETFNTHLLKTRLFEVL